MDANITFTGSRKDINEIEKELIKDVHALEQKHPEAKLEKLETKIYECQRCGRRLTAKRSIKNGFGPVCMKKRYQIKFN